MSAKATLTWKDNLYFIADVDGFAIPLDTSIESGGGNLGSRPKTLLLAALSGCSGMDTVSILKKMRVKDYELVIDMEANPAHEHPKIYKTIHMTFNFKGPHLPPEKVINAVELSITKYCAVYAMLKPAVNIITRININGKEVWSA